jgi:large subunit ribosomal protein L22
MEVIATAKWVSTTARKARLVAATIEGLSVNEALTILSFTPRAAAIEVAKVIKSAAANAEHNYNLDIDDLRIARVEIEGAAIIKRFRPRAQGRAFSIFKRTTHLRAVVTDEAPSALLRRRVRAAGAGVPSPTRRRAAEAEAAPTAAGAPTRRRRQPRASQADAEPRTRPSGRKAKAQSPAAADTESAAENHNVEAE